MWQSIRAVPGRIHARGEGQGRKAPWKGGRPGKKGSRESSRDGKVSR